MNTLFAKLLQSYKTTFIAVLLLCFIPLVVSYFIQGNWGGTVTEQTGFQQFVTFCMSFSLWFAGVLMCLSTLKDGALGGLYLLPIMLVPAAFAAYMASSSVIFLHLGLLKFGFAFVLAYTLMRTASWGLTIDLGCLIVLAVVCGYYYFLPSPGQHWLEVMLQQTDMVEQLRQQLGDEKLMYSLTTMSSIATGLSALISWCEVMSMLMFARWIQARMYNPGGLGKELMQARCSFVMAMVAVVCFGYAIMGVPVAIDSLVVAVWPVSITGLILVHVFAKGALGERSWMMMVPVYILGMLLSLYALMLLAIIGVINSVVRLFSWQKPSSPDEMKS